MSRDLPQAPISTAETPVHVKPGYRQAHYQESSDGFGCLIFLMSPLPVCDMVSSACYTAAEKVLVAARTTAVLADPLFLPNKQTIKDEILDCFPGAWIYAEEIPNGYGDPQRDPYYLRFPWFIVTTRIGHITIGWRKRVLSIDWSRTIVKAKAIHLFPDEDVTREGQLIHAWGYEKAKEYLKLLHSPSALLVPADGINSLRV